jgi:TolB-like protein/Tfp pilus assembly protein PilF
LSLFNELKRRNVLRVAAAYAVASWLVIQVVETVFPAFGFGDAAVRIVTIVVAIGLIPALIFSWAFEITSEGLKKEKDVDRSQSISPQTGKKLDRMIMVVLALALGLFAFDKFVLSESREASIAEEARQEGRSEAMVESYGGNSIAVLPFVNMSDDAANEYFSDGISEELLNLLTKIPELRVAARTSSFFYKDKLDTITLAEVAQKLQVVYLLEGSVRKSGNRVRITVQLIKADDGFHLWSQTFDRTLDNIFTIQDEIASEVVGHLKITLLGDAPTVWETDPQAYALYLQGRHLRRLGSTAGIERAQVLLQKALDIDPDFAAAWGELGFVYISQANTVNLRPIDEGNTLAREAINNALAINPEYALAHAGLGWIAMTYDNDLTAAARHLERAMQLEPGNTEIIRRAARLSVALGRLDEAIALVNIAVASDPVNPQLHSNLALFYIYAERWDKVIASMRTTLTLSPGYVVAQYDIGTALLFKGEPQAALEAMQLEDSSWGMIGLPLAYHALGEVNESDAALAELIEQYEQGWAYNIAYVLAYRDEADRAFEWLEKAIQYKDPGLSEIPVEPLFSNIHDDPRWLPFLESIGKSPEQLAAIKFEVTLPE